MLDSQAPSFGATCPANQVVVLPSGVASIAVSWTAPQATDDRQVKSVDLVAGYPSGSLFPIGDTTVKFVASDLYGNTALCEFVVTVQDTQVRGFFFCATTHSFPSSLVRVSRRRLWSPAPKTLSRQLYQRHLLAPCPRLDS